jgi:hypothetical protein
MILQNQFCVYIVYFPQCLIYISVVLAVDQYSLWFNIIDVKPLADPAISIIQIFLIQNNFDPQLITVELSCFRIITR